MPDDAPLPLEAQGVHSDLYRAPGTVTTLSFGQHFCPILIDEIRDVSTAAIQLATHVDDTSCLDVHYHQLPASDVFKLLYDNWNTLHFFT